MDDAQAPTLNANACRRAIDAMAEALRWYGDRELAYAITQGHEPRSPVHADKGARARAALIHAAAVGLLAADQVNLPAEALFPPASLRVILAGIERIEFEMSKVQDAIAAQTQVDDALAVEVQALIAAFQGFAAQEKADLAAALAQAGLDDDTNASVVAASTTRLQAFVDQIKAVIPAAPAALAITPLSITGTAGQPVTGQVVTTGGVAPVTFSASGGPADLTIDPTSGAIGGTPAEAESGSISLTATDSSTPPLTASASIPFSIVAAS